MNLLSIKEEETLSFTYKNETYYYLNPTDIKKLPITEKYKEILLSSSKILPIDRNTMRTIGEAIRQIKINRKKFPEFKSQIENYYRHVLEEFLSFNIGTSEACNICKNFNPKSNDTIIVCKFEDEVRTF